MKFQEYFENARKHVVIVGTNPLMPHLEQSTQFFADLLTLKSDLTLTILFESDFENFGQSLLVDSAVSIPRTSYSTLKVHRARISGTPKDERLIGGFRNDLLDHIDSEPVRTSVADRITVHQINLRMPVNIIRVDDALWCCITSYQLPTAESYHSVDPAGGLGKSLLDLIEFYSSPKGGGVYLSEPGEELIELYDRNSYPRGIFPRSCFYTTTFQRYSVWGFIFNRNGQLLLQQRSRRTKDGQSLWDKSIGGHVDLLDSSTYITAQRELVEELFLPEAEFTKYARADLGDIVNFGDWHPRKRAEKSFRDAFAGLGPNDWIMFRATDEQTGDPLTVTRISRRRLHDAEGRVTVKPTVFRSDVYLFIAPEGFADTPEQAMEACALAEEQGAASDHKLVTMEALREWIDEKEADDTAAATFTDDLLHINVEQRSMLETFVEFVRYLR